MERTEDGIVGMIAYTEENADGTATAGCCFDGCTWERTYKDSATAQEAVDQHQEDVHDLDCF